MQPRMELAQFRWRALPQPSVAKTPEAVAAFFVVNGSQTVGDGSPAVGRSAIADIARSSYSLIISARDRMNSTGIIRS